MTLRIRTGKDKLFNDVKARGIAARRELLALGHRRDFIDIAAAYGTLIRVRKGWYAAPDELEEIIRAWRVGGRATCVTALALHLGEQPPATLHVEVPGNTARLRSPRWAKRPLAAQDQVVVHWARHPSPGDRRAVGVADAARVAATCAQAASSESASRIV